MTTTRAILFVLLGLLSTLARAGFYDQSGEEARLIAEISYRVDTGADTTFEKIAASDEGWISQRTKRHGFTGESVRIWARFDLPPSTRERRVYVVTGPWESVEYFFVRDGKLMDHQWAGTLVPWSRQTTRVTMTSYLKLSGFAAIDTPVGTTTRVFARLSTGDRFVKIGALRFSLWDEERVRAEEGRDRLLQGTFLGIMLVLVVYNLALYFLEGRDASYPYYVIGLLSIAASWVAVSGLGHEILWPDHPAWDHYSVWIVSPVGMYSLAQFVRRYLDMGKHMPRLDVQLKWIALGCLILPPLLLFPSKYVPALREAEIGFVWIPLAGGVAILWVCGVALAKRLPSARLFALAIGCAVVGAFISAPATVPGGPPLLIHAHQVGAALMGILLSIGMGFRVRDLRAELAAKRIEEARLAGERHQLEIASRHKSEFLANMSHELRTPLNAIIGFSDVMLSGMAGPMPEKQKEFTNDIRDSGKHLLGLINDILDLSKIEAGRMELEVAPFDVRVAMDNAMTLVRTRADRHGIRLESAVAPEIAEYRGDERKFKQIMLNLLSNAVKFTPEGGTVTMSAGKSDGSYLFSVKDTGVGIAPEDHQRIFEEFRQVGDTARRAEGTGLGLTLTRKLVELHGGRIRVDSAPGKGSTFTFNLPIGQT